MRGADIAARPRCVPSRSAVNRSLAPGLEPDTGSSWPHPVAVPCVEPGVALRSLSAVLEAGTVHTVLGP